MKIRPLGAELFHVDRWADGPTDLTKLMVAFHSFANEPKTVDNFCVSCSVCK
jgi:hypothetical protein